MRLNALQGIVLAAFIGMLIYLACFALLPILGLDNHNSEVKQGMIDAKLD